MTVTTPDPSRGLLPPHRVLAEPLLRFGPGTATAVGPHPLRGLLSFGPYSRGSFGEVPVRIATVTTSTLLPRLRAFLGDLRNEHQPTDRRRYLPPYPGFKQIFGVDVVPAQSEANALVDERLADATDPHAAISAGLIAAVRQLNSVRSSWDVLVALLPRNWYQWKTSSDEAFDLHDILKATAAPVGAPTQLMWEDRALTYQYKCSLAWRLSIALYAKAGGTPWRLDRDSDTDVAYVGISYAIRGGTRDAFVTCCSQVFDADGGGMDFVAYDVGQGVDLDNPHLTRDQMRAVMSRSVRLYQDRHAGHLPQRIVVHKTTSFRDDEADAVLDAWSACREVECVRIQSSTPWRAVQLVAPKPGPDKSQPDNWPVRRGTLQYLSGRDALLYVNGTAPGLASGAGNFFQGGKGIPKPLLLTRDAGAGPLERSAADVLALTKMDWNNDALYDPLPVTIKYSQTLAQVISHAKSMPAAVYPYRLFM